MKTIKEMIEVMQAYADGKKIEYRAYEEGEKWQEVWSNTTHAFNWEMYDYRIKPEQTTRPMTLEEIIEWRKNSNGVIINKDTGTITTVEMITPDDIESTICTSRGCWHSVDDFIKHYRKPYGEKFEVEL